MMMKRADGSVSKRGLYDNLRKKAAENKRTGAKPKKVDDGLRNSMAATERSEMKNGGNISCWKGYAKKGTKTLKGKTVNNCVKKK
jgi:hypothetical protein